MADLAIAERRPIKSWPASEVDLGRQLVPWLETEGFEVYQEVKIQALDATADVVAKRPGELWVIELKVSLGLSVIEQAERWLPFAHRVFVGVPYNDVLYSGHRLPHRVLKWLGVGAIEISSTNVRVIIPARVNASIHVEVFDGIRPEHRDYAEAGTNSGRSFTPWQQTCDNLRAAVAAHPGQGMSYYLKQIATHYRKPELAYGALLAQVQRGVVRGLEARKVVGGKWRLYVKEAVEAGTVDG